MLRGMKVPLKVTPYGGADAIEGPSVVAQNIFVAITPSSNRNPWLQNITTDESITFDIADDRSVGGLLVTRIKEIFDRFAQRGYAKLLPGSQGLRYKVYGSQAFVFIRYMNLENDKTETVRVPVR